MSLKRNAVKNSFSHIYVEEEILTHENTIKILSFFKDAKVIVIHDYKDVFNRKHQSHALQKESQNLILAKKKKDFLYVASPVCQSFNNEYFYYSSCIMNCIYDCEYCFLKGMYPSGNIVVFVNIEDFFVECEKLLQQHPVYLCVSYDTDMLALEPILHYAEKWSNFVLNHENITIEIRTKGTYSLAWKKLLVSEKIVIAFSLSPEYVSKTYEKGTPSFTKRIQMIKEMMDLGYPVRICFDPIIFFKGWENAYQEMIDVTKNEIDLTKIKDISIGSFRISKDYLSIMRKQYPNSAILQYPYVCENGFYQLPEELRRKLESFVLDQIKEIVDKDKIFEWEN